MNVLIIGFSSIVRRRVLPALVSLSDVDKIYLASRRELPTDVLPPDKCGKVYQGYMKALTECEPCVAYISLPNSLHAEWAYHALNAGFHVIIDKPAVINISDAETLVDLANQKGLCLAEANVWVYHPAVQMLKTLINNEENKPTMVSVIFSSPLSIPPTIHYFPELGGGILFDRGPYPISCGRVFFGTTPKEIIYRGISRDKKVDISCSIMFCYDNGILLSFLSLDGEYQNALSIIGSNYHFYVERIFTPPADYECKISVKRRNQSEIISGGQADNFALFITDVLNAIKNKSFNHFSEILLEDAKMLHNLNTRGGSYAN